MWIDEFISWLPGMVRQVMESLIADFPVYDSPFEADVTDEDQTGELNPQQQEWADKAIRKYAESQRKKVWQRWNDAMFEKK